MVGSSNGALHPRVSLTNHGATDVVGLVLLQHLYALAQLVGCLAVMGSHDGYVIASNLTDPCIHTGRGSLARIVNNP